MFSPAFLGAAVSNGFSLSEVFATTLYTGNGATRDIVSGLDFVGNEGLVWIKSRTSTNSHNLVDTIRGPILNLNSSSTTAEVSNSRVLSLNADGFSLTSNANVNGSGNNYAAWQFIKKAGFFDIVQYTGDSVAGRTVALDLDDGTAVFGMSIVKRTDLGGIWMVQHKDIAATNYMALSSTAASAAASTIWNNTAATGSALTLGTNGNVNVSGGTYISYNFAHNPTKGIFCGSYTGTGSNNAITTGFPVGWLLIKASSFSQLWVLVDIKRAGMDNGLYPSAISSEGSGFGISSTSDGFLLSTASGNTNGETFIFMAIADPAQF